MTNRSGIQWKNTAWDFYGNVLQWLGPELSEPTIHTGSGVPPPPLLGVPNDFYFADSGEVYKKFPDPTGWVYLGDLSGGAIDPDQLAAIGGMRYRYDAPINASLGAYPVGAKKGELYPIGIKGVILNVEYAAGDFALYDGTGWRRVTGDTFAYERQYDFTDNSTQDIVVGSTTLHRSVLVDYTATASTYHQFGSIRIIHNDLVCEIDHQRTGVPSNIDGLEATALVSGTNIVLRFVATSVGSNINLMLKNRNTVNKTI